MDELELKVTAGSEKWDNLEEKIDQAIHEVMFTDASGGTPSLAALLGVIKTAGSVPAPAQERANRISALVGNLGGNAAQLSGDAKIQLGNDLLAFLRFVCHRGNYP
jgi:hypothetical protein